MKLYDLKARRPHTVGHRTLEAGETLSRLQFKSAEDAKFFINHLRWSAFEVVEAPMELAPKTKAKKSDAAPV